MTEPSDTRLGVLDISSTGIHASAKIVWEAVQGTDSFKHATVGKYHGMPGWYWHGAVNQVINDLWPDLNDRYLVDKEVAEETKRTINRFLRQNKAMVCTKDGGYVKPSLWWVSNRWPELTVIPGTREDHGGSALVTDDAAMAEPVASAASVPSPLDVFSVKQGPAPAVPQEGKSEEEMMSGPIFQEPDVKDVPEVAVDEPQDRETITFGCRYPDCSERYEGVHHRATHELRHGMRVNEDGTITEFDPTLPAPDEEQVQTLLIKVAEGREPMTQSLLVEEVRKLSPRASSNTIKIVLQILTDEKWFKLNTTVVGTKGRHRRYEYLGEPVKKTRKAKSLTEAVDAAESALDRVIESSDVGFMETAVATIRTGDESSVERYRGLLSDLLADLDLLDALRDQLRVTRDELAETKAALAEAQARAADTEDLERVTRERDQLRGRLDTLKSALGSL